MILVFLRVFVKNVPPPTFGMFLRPCSQGHFPKKVPKNNWLYTDTVPVNNLLFTGTLYKKVPVIHISDRDNHLLNIPISNQLLTGTVL